MRWKIVVPALLIATTMTAVVPVLALASWGKTEIQVFCFIGNRNDNDYVGTVDVFDVRQASSLCNLIYNDCQGGCTGCFDDEDSREICVDRSGASYYY